MMSAGDIRYSENIPHHSEAYVLYVNLNTITWYRYVICHFTTIIIVYCYYGGC